MSERNTVMRSMHELGLAAWFGGALMGAIGLNGAAQSIEDHKKTLRISSTGWARWTPLNAAAIGSYLIGGLAIIKANRGRIKYQQGVAASTVWKTAFTGAALAATAYARVLGKRVEQAAAEDADIPQNQPQAMPNIELATAERQLRIIQWSVPVLTGALGILNALQGEQQRGDQEVRGYLAQNLWPLG